MVYVSIVTFQDDVFRIIDNLEMSAFAHRSGMGLELTWLIYQRVLKEWSCTGHSFTSQRAIQRFGTEPSFLTIKPTQQASKSLVRTWVRLIDRLCKISWLFRDLETVDLIRPCLPTVSTATLLFPYIIFSLSLYYKMNDN
jgi:hypothetical protein